MLMTTRPLPEDVARTATGRRLCGSRRSTRSSDPGMPGRPASPHSILTPVPAERAPTPVSPLAADLPPTGDL